MNKTSWWSIVDCKKVLTLCGWLLSSERFRMNEWLTLFQLPSRPPARLTFVSGYAREI